MHGNNLFRKMVILKFINERIYLGKNYQWMPELFIEKLYNFTELKNQRSYLNQSKFKKPMLSISTQYFLLK